MKQIISIFTILLFAQMARTQQQKDAYKPLWQQVEKLENDDLTKSALKLVTRISDTAKKEKNTAQIVKALLYTSKYALVLEEDAQLHIINDFKSAIAETQSPTKNVLEGYLANMYWQYFEQNRYRFYNRTKTEIKVDTTDFRTWDLSTLFQEIRIHFDASLENENLLKQTLVSAFDPILNQQENTEEYRPSLFDLLAHNALSFYRTSENNIIRPADKFEINDPDFLCNGKDFINQKIDPKDSTSLQAKALGIYQKLLMLHLPSAKPYTFAEINIERLNFIYENATFDHKDEQFLEVLQHSASATKGSLAASLYQHQIARVLYRQGQEYKALTKKENRWKIKEALTICNAVIKNFPDSRGAEQCKSLKSQILQKSLQLTTEGHIPIQKTARFLVNYKNLKGLKFNAYRVNQATLNKLDGIYDKESHFS